MQKVSSLLFELSSTDRLDILMLVQKSPLKLSHISSKLNFTVQEASRNLARLSEAQLVRKDADGAFYLTSYGEETLFMLKGFSFLVNNRDYLLTHTASRLPKHLRASIGVLEGFEFVDDVMTVFHNAEKMIAKAEKYVWIMTNQVLASTIPFLLEEVERGGEFRLLMPKDYAPSEEMRNLVTNPVFAKAARNGKLDQRFIESVDVFLGLSEKEVAALAFPTIDGKLDYTGFRAEGEEAVEYGKTLFSYYWSIGSSIIPDKLLGKK